MRWLAKYTIPGAEFDSSARDPPPRCYPGTRIAIIEKIRHWIDDRERLYHLLWLNGPAGVGKSAIVQTLAEELSSTPKLGATVFFSSLNNCNRPSRVLPTIAYQLAVRIPAYKEYLEKKMIDDPRLLEKSVGHQFHSLIVWPYTSLGLATKHGAWVILLDGLDECDGKEAQISIIKLISRFSRQYPAAPFVWLISSRPEAHLSVAFESREVGGTFWTHYISPNSHLACRDVEKFIRARFEEIRNTYANLMPAAAPWPLERDIVAICDASLGFFIFPSALIRFIDDPHICDPISQLMVILSVTGEVQTDPLTTLHTFYSRILDGVPKSMLPDLKLLLAYALMSPSPIIQNDEGGDNYPLVLSATLFGIEQHAVYAVLQKLHSVVRVPALSKSGLQDIRFYHTSFADFLCDASKSGAYAIDPEHFHKKLWWSSFVITQRKYPFCGFTFLQTFTYLSLN